MESVEIKTEKYYIAYYPNTSAVRCEGALLLNGSQEYEPILQLFKQAAKSEQQSKKLTIDLRSLKFLNSSGINMMTKFVIHASDIEALELVLVAYKNVAWHEKLLKNLKRLMPSLTTQLE